MAPGVGDDLEIVAGVNGRVLGAMIGIVAIGWEVVVVGAAAEDALVVVERKARRVDGLGGPRGRRKEKFMLIDG